MTDINARALDRELKRGSAELLILSLLDARPRHGYDLSKLSMTDAGGHVIAPGGGNVIAPGGANVVAAGGANVVASGGGNVLLPLSGVVAAGGLN